MLFKWRFGHMRMASGELSNLAICRGHGCGKKSRRGVTERASMKGSESRRDEHAAVLPWTLQGGPAWFAYALAVEPLKSAFLRFRNLYSGAGSWIQNQDDARTACQILLDSWHHAQIEVQGLQDDVVVGASLVNMHGKCGSLEDAHRVFDRLSQKNVVTWTAMITFYFQQGMGQEALTLHSSVQQAGLTPDSVTFVCLLQASARVGAVALHHGKQLYAQIQERGLQDDVALGASLVSMYSKCGSKENDG